MGESARPCGPHSRTARVFGGNYFVHESPTFSDGDINTSIHQKSESNRDPSRVLTLFDCVCIIVGTIIGAGIFKMPAIVSTNVPNVMWLALVWIVGGMIALIGALCFAELTTTYPDRGGDYGYLKRAYHPRIGFAFSWAAFWIIRPGNIGAMAMIFGEFAHEAARSLQVGDSSGWNTPMVLAVASVIVISATNLMGIVFGKTIQNILTVAKVVGILLIVISAFVFSRHANRPDLSPANKTGQSQVALHQPDDSPAEGDRATSSAPETSEQESDADFDGDLEADQGDSSGSNQSLWASFWLSMVFVMFTFGGWNDIAFVATEVKHPQRNLLRSLVIGTSTVLVIYLLVNFALVFGLGFKQMVQIGSEWGNPTSVLVEQRMGTTGSTLFAVLVCISCLGAINAMIFTSPRIYWATAMDYPSLGWLAGSSDGSRGWWRAMLLQAGVTILFVLVFGANSGGIDRIVAATAPFFWFFLALTVLSLIVMRIRFSGQFQGYRVPFYPVLPLAFVAACCFMMYQACQYMIDQNLWISAAAIAGWVVFGAVLSLFLGGGRSVVNE